MEDKRARFKLGGISELANFLARQEQGMKKTFRWWEFPKAGMCRWQTSYEHTVDITWLSILVVDYLLQFYPNLDAYLILKGAFLHDFGEIIFDKDSPGDVSLHIKENNNNHRQGELRVFCQLFDNFKDKERILADLVPYYLMQYGMEPATGERLLESVNLSEWKDKLFKNKEFEAKVFDAMEILGYLVFVYQEYIKNPEVVLPLFILALRKHCPTLLIYNKEIKGFSHFYSVKDHQAILRFLADNKDVPDALAVADKIINERAKALNDEYCKG